MKLITSILVCFIAFSVQAQNSKSDYLSKCQSLDSTLETLYGVISGEKGEARNWNLFNYLFTPNAKLIPSTKNKDGIYELSYLSPQDYIDQAGSWLIENGFFEKEIHRTVNTFGNITQVFSTYESFRSETDKVPFMRGINSIQLLNDGNRWWVVNIYWTQESEENRIPFEYLPKQ